MKNGAMNDRRFMSLLELMGDKKSAKDLRDQLAGYAVNEWTPARIDRDTSGGAAWSHAYGERLERMRAQCRSIVRDDSLARAMVKMHQALVVGDGAVIRSTSDDDAWNKECDRLFMAWADGHGEIEGIGHPDVERKRSLWNICNLIVRAWDVDGDVLAIKLGTSALEDAGSLQLVEADRIRSPISPMSIKAAAGSTNIASSSTSGTTVDGVVRSLRGRPLAYKVHNWSAMGMGYTSGDPTTIEAKDAWLLINPSDDAVGMVRGEPGLQACVTRLERLNKFSERHAIMALVATLFGIILSGPDAQDLNEAMQETGDDENDEDSPKSIKLETAGVLATGPGTTATQVAPQAPNTNFREYVLSEFMMCCADLGLPICFVLFDAMSISYIAARAMGSIAMRRLASQQAEIATFIRNVRGWRVNYWISIGKLKTNPQWARCEVHMPVAPVFDPGAEVAATLDAIAGRVMTYEQATQMLGTGKASEVHAQLKREIEALRSSGIEPADKPGAKSPGVPTGAKKDVADPKTGETIKP